MDKVMENQRQQGDVCYEKVPSIPNTAKKMKPIGGRYIIAEGEATGHAHAVKEVEWIEFFEDNGTIYLKNTTKEPVILNHEEHNNHILEADDIWKFERLYEYDYLENITRILKD